MHPATAAVIKWFDYRHLPADLQEVVAPIAALATEMASKGEGPELTAGLRKLLEAKDCFVRTTIEAREASSS
jgi:hypothetical protein